MNFSDDNAAPTRSGGPETTLSASDPSKTANGSASGALPQEKAVSAQVGESADGSDTPFARTHDGSMFPLDGRMDEAALQDLLIWASELKASDITIQSESPVILDIGGKLHRVTPRPLGNAEVSEIIDVLYGGNAVTELKSGHDLDPGYDIRVAEKGRMRYRVNATACRTHRGDGLQVTIRTLPDMPIRIDQLGLEPAIIENFAPAQGITIITGPTGSGKSTILASGMRMILEDPNSHDKILEYSKPIEQVYDRIQSPSSTICQTEVGRHLRPRGDNITEDDEFAYCVRNALRRKPTKISIGEARDRATIAASIEAARTGHGLYTTMHSIGVAETTNRAILPFPSADRGSIGVDLMDSLNMIVTQLLLPRAGGGRVAAREYLVFDATIRRTLIDTPMERWAATLREIMQSEYAAGQTMLQAATRLRDAGEIDDHTFHWVSARSRESQVGGAKS